MLLLSIPLSSCAPNVAGRELLLLLLAWPLLAPVLPALGLPLLADWVAVLAPGLLELELEPVKSKVAGSWVEAAMPVCC